RMWRSDGKLDSERITLVGVWAIPPVVGLFLFYCGMGNLVTRYATDLFPGFVAAILCVGMALVDAVRRRAPRLTSAVELLLCGAAALYAAGWRGWVTKISHPCEQKNALRIVTTTEAASHTVPPPPSHFESAQPHDTTILGAHQLADWHSDGRFASGFLFA